jgi:hypothetical protein
VVRMAASEVSNRQVVRPGRCPKSAGWQPAIRQAGSLRYLRQCPATSVYQAWVWSLFHIPGSTLSCASKGGQNNMPLTLEQKVDSARVLARLIEREPARLGGVPVFRGTRVTKSGDSKRP